MIVQPVPLVDADDQVLPLSKETWRISLASSGELMRPTTVREALPSVVMKSILLPSPVPVSLLIREMVVVLDGGAVLISNVPTVPLLLAASVALSV